MFVSHVIRKLALKRKLRSWRKGAKSMMDCSTAKFSSFSDGQRQKQKEKKINFLSVAAERNKKFIFFGINANLKVHALVVLHGAIKLITNTRIGWSEEQKKSEEMSFFVTAASVNFKLQSSNELEGEKSGKFRCGN